MATDTTDLTIEILRRMQADQAAIGRDMRQLQQSQVDLVRLISRMEARMSEIRSDLETMFKMELVGQHAHQLTRMEQLVDARLEAQNRQLDERFVAWETHLDDKLGAMEERLAGRPHP